MLLLNVIEAFDNVSHFRFIGVFEIWLQTTRAASVVLAVVILLAHV
jgi:hypothetical protein